MESSPFPPDSETSFTFKVDPVELSNEAPALTSVEDILREKILGKYNFPRIWDPLIDFKGKFEDCSHRKDMKTAYVSDKMSGLVVAIHEAYQWHNALSLSVSDFIILIGQGLGAHITKNAEKLRKHFVDHEGKETIVVERDDFVLGEQNDWSTVFGEFAKQIKEKVKGDVYDVIVDDTSVATENSRIVSEITLMEAMKGYFDYRANTLCGIPHITLEGKPEDWQKFKDKVRKLAEMNQDDCLDLKWWLDELVPVVDKICEAGIDRKVDKEFWSNIYKYHDGSGGDQVTGWIIKFFPYVASYYGANERNKYDIMFTGNIPRHVSEVPFVWRYLGKDIPMKFSAGFLGAEWNQDLCQLKPVHFWCVTQDEEEKK